jgi:Fe-S-cluster containining protein/predicted transcriptional regulator
VDAALARWRDHRAIPHGALPQTAHRCHGCGRSCEGHLVGPLTPAEAARVQALWPALVEALPRLQGEEPLVRLRLQGQEGLYLESREGRCVFLGEDRRCELHRRFGAESKPAACRMFPWVRLRTETGLRLGVKPGCARAHLDMVASEGEPELISALPDDLPSPLLDRALGDRHPLEPGPARPASPLEGEILALLGAPGASLPGLIGLLTGAAAPGDGERALPAAAQALAWPLLRRFARGVQREGTLLGEMLTHPDAHLGGAFRAVLEAIDALPEAPGAPLPYTAQQERWAVECLRGLFYTREALVYPSPLVATSSFLLGFALALHAHGDRYEPWGAHLAAWWRLLGSEDAPRGLFETHEEVSGWLLAWAEG